MPLTITHPTPVRFALAMSAIGAADHGIRSEVDERGNSALVTFENGHEVEVVEGPLQAEYNL